MAGFALLGIAAVHGGYPMAPFPGGAGALRHRVTIEQKVSTADGQGGQTVTWTVWHSNVPARVEPLSGTELFQAGALQAQIDYRVHLRWRDGLSPTQRVLWGDRVLEVQAVIPPEVSTDETQLMCTELDVT